jgi:hypothetical protein
VSRPHARLAAELILGGVLAGVVFGAAGGSELSRTSVVEVLMVLAGGLLVAAAVIWSPPGRLNGGLTVALFALLAALTALSITWAVVPSLAYVEANRTLAYLAVFAGAVAAARLAPRAAPVAINGILLAAMAAVLYAIAARVWPGSLGETEISNRIGQPFQYWNAVGTTAALAIPGLLWLGTRRAAAIGRVLAYPGLGAAVLAILLTQSRGALAAAVIGTLAWLAIVPVRMRALPLIFLPSAAAGAVAAWALSKDAFSVAGEPLRVKEAVAGEFGLLVLLMLAVLVAAGLLVNAALARELPPLHIRRRVGVVALAIACVAPLVAFTAVAFSDRGIGGTIGDRVDQLTSETETAPGNQEGAARLTDASSTRGKYWREAGRVFDDRPSIGLGAGNFATARLRHRTDLSSTRHAHGFVPQTMADLGIVGLVVTGALLIAWLVGAARVTGLYPRRLPFRKASGEPPPRRDWTGDRIALVTLTLMAVVFGLQSAIDWTWFVPGPTAMALVAAGFVIGQAPLGAAPEPAAAGAPSSGRLLAGSGVLVAAIVVAWAIWQPEASDRDTTEAIRLADAGETAAAIARTAEAADENPLNPDPLLTRAAIETDAGLEDAAQATLEQAVLKFPGDPQTWYRLAAFQLGTLDEPVQASSTLRGALFLDPLSPVNRQLYLAALARAREQP